MSALHIIMPVKDSIETTREALAHLYASTDRDWTFTLYNDFSTKENTTKLKQLACKYGFKLVNWAEHTTHPSPNYLMTLQHSQATALADEADLLIIESDVLIEPDTISRLRAAKQPGTGMIAAVTHDEEGQVNFPYQYAKRWAARPTETTKRFSFCCTLLTNEFLGRYSFGLLDPEKNWFDVTISHKSVELGMRNILLMDTPVLHKPHSSRPWKLLKYTNPVKYYLLKLFHHRDRI